MAAIFATHELFNPVLADLVPLTRKGISSVVEMPFVFKVYELNDNLVLHAPRLAVSDAKVMVASGVTPLRPIAMKPSAMTGTPSYLAVPLNTV